MMGITSCGYACSTSRQQSCEEKEGREGEEEASQPASQRASKHLPSAARKSALWEGSLADGNS